MNSNENYSNKVYENISNQTQTNEIVNKQIMKRN